MIFDMGQYKAISWRYVEDCLDNLFKSGQGTVTLTRRDFNDGDIISLQVALDIDGFLLALMMSVHGKYTTKDYWDKKAQSGLICILDDYYDLPLVCKDPNVAYRAFRSFYETGAVPKDIIDVT